MGRLLEDDEKVEDIWKVSLKDLSLFEQRC